MLRVKPALCAVVVAASAVAVQASPAQAAAHPTYAPPTVKTMPVVVASSDGTAVVHATYTCFGGTSAHLYIGLKQGPQVNATDHTSSQYADTFYSTNYNSDGPGLTLTCDGRKHNQKFVLEPDPYFALAHPNAPALSSGQTFVQFCIFDSTNTGEDDPNGFGFDYSMRKVVVRG